jgi:protein-tyrosine phosphatase
MFTILIACTGNRCRSPFAQAYLARLVRNLPVEVLSAGTLDSPGNKVPAELIEIGRAGGLDLSQHRSRFLAPGEFSAVDLFIGFERGHVAAAVVDAGIPYEKAFTLPELVRLLEEVGPLPSGDPVERARSAISAAAEQRQRGADFVPGEEVADPFRGSVDVYQRSVDEMAALSSKLHELLFAAG